jgi:hypothetical protein
MSFGIMDLKDLSLKMDNQQKVPDMLLRHLKRHMFSIDYSSATVGRLGRQSRLGAHID